MNCARYAGLDETLWANMHAFSVTGDDASGYSISTRHVSQGNNLYAAGFCLNLFVNHTAFELYSLRHVGYLLDDLHGCGMCSHVGLSPHNPAHRPRLHQGATAFGFNALLLVLA